MSAANPTPSFDQAADKLRAAQIRRQLAGDRSRIFVHSPRPAFVPAEQDNAWQRSFGADVHTAICGLRLQHPEDLDTSISVLRLGEKNVARLQIQLGSAGYVRAVLTASELRETAARLIDAAHDIEAHPAAALATAGEAA